MFVIILCNKILTWILLSDASAPKRKRRSKYAIHFNTADLHSIRRSDPKLTWSYAVFILKDGTTLPALHFHSGGISEMVRRLQRYIWLTKWAAFIFITLVEAQSYVIKNNVFCVVNMYYFNLFLINNKMK